MTIKIKNIVLFVFVLLIFLAGSLFAYEKFYAKVKHNIYYFFPAKNWEIAKNNIVKDCKVFDTIGNSSKSPSSEYYEQLQSVLRSDKSKRPLVILVEKTNNQNGNIENCLVVSIRNKNKIIEGIYERENGELTLVRSKGK